MKAKTFGLTVWICLNLLATALALFFHSVEANSVVVGVLIVDTLIAAIFLVRLK